MVLRGLQSREVQQLLAGNPWAGLLQQAVGRVAAVGIKHLTQA
jgi:hypothetical protein